MARCEDYPCCGHELGCCPDYDEETGAQLNMKCTCGATLDINARWSICNGCLRAGDESGYFEDGSEYGDGDDFDETQPAEADGD